MSESVIAVAEKLYLPGPVTTIAYPVDQFADGWAVEMSCSLWPESHVGDLTVQVHWAGQVEFQTLAAIGLDGGGIGKNGLLIESVRVSGTWPHDPDINGQPVIVRPTEMRTSLNVEVPIVSSLDINTGVVEVVQP